MLSVLSVLSVVKKNPYIMVDTSTRSSGVLLHPTSLPGPYGIGDLGGPAYRWIDSLAYARQKWWQILPLNPTGYGDSPYSSPSAFAGNPYLVSPELLLQDGLLQQSDVPDTSFPLDRIDYGMVVPWKTSILGKAWEHYKAGTAPQLKGEVEAFENKQSSWLDDYALFRSLRDKFGGQSWYEWPTELRERQPAALEQARIELADGIGFHKFCQFLFFKQWIAVENYAHEKDILIFGDAPIFVSADSSDVWANPQLFQLDENRHPRVVAGVPPDYFSSTGQLWGNPLYDWDTLRQTKFQWWIDRIRNLLQVVDVVRIDHFRGFESYWEVPAGMPTAEIGQWVKAPGEELFTTLRDALGGLPLVAEDLGIITPEVDKLRMDFELQGMRVLQFAFGGASDNPYLPHNYDTNTVVYTGTHDNNTTRGWFNQAGDKEKNHVRSYMARDASDVSWDMIRMAWSSVGNIAIAPLQDILDLGTDARMNFPGKPEGNWGWRYREEMITSEVLDRLGELTELYGRCTDT